MPNTVSSCSTVSAAPLLQPLRAPAAPPRVPTSRRGYATTDQLDLPVSTKAPIAAADEAPAAKHAAAWGLAALLTAGAAAAAAVYGGTYAATALMRAPFLRLAADGMRDLATAVGTFFFGAAGGAVGTVTQTCLTVGATRDGAGAPELATQGWRRLLNPAKRAIAELRRELARGMAEHRAAVGFAGRGRAGARAGARLGARLGGGSGRLVGIAQGSVLGGVVAAMIGLSGPAMVAVGLACWVVGGLLGQYPGKWLGQIGGGLVGGALGAIVGALKQSS